MTLTEALAAARPPDEAARARAAQRLAGLLKPIDSLGLLERQLLQVAAATGMDDMVLDRKAVVVFCADNGVVAQGVSQSGQEVTAIVARNMARGRTCVCNMARVAGAEVVPVDVGVAADLQDVPGLWPRKVAHGTRDFSREAAMDRDQAVRALEVGIEVAGALKKRGVQLLATGEMGIGNTTTAAALAAVLLDKPVAAVVGRGAGLSAAALARKRVVIEQGIALHRPRRDDALDTLCKLGGLDIAAMAGLCIGGAVWRLPVLLDGVISLVAALVAVRLQPLVRGVLLASHVSAEPAGALLLEALELEAPLHAGLCLGEGSGAVAAMPLLDMMLAVYRNMIAFEDERMVPYERYGAEEAVAGSRE